jgi:CRISPR-associated protein Cmr6
LVLAYYLPKTGDDGESKRKLLDRAIKASHRTRPLYEKAFQRAYPGLALRRTVAVDGRLIVGLGAQTALETGITLHHTYGTPILLGSGLKGLAAHYCAEVWGNGRPEFRKDGEWYHEVFGGTDDAGFVIFHDAWITPGSLKPDSGLVLDVMTPHHGDYYMKKTKAPTDFDDPNPVGFLSVAGTFELAVSCGDMEDADSKRWAGLAMELLLQAAGDWGVGGKTNSGYGRMHELPVQ